ncbi:MAG: M13 family metallopeptidase [candidate division NC10 bacterium]|nr:M13 family metallopeptidase [candidate division NC10 bacterium]
MAHVTRRPSPFLLALGLSLGMLFLADRPPCEGFDPENMDASVNPCADFFEYAAGAWERRTSIPPSYSQYGVDQEVEQRTFTIVKDILEDAATDTLAPKGSERQKVGDFFASGMDVARIEAEGVRPLESFFARIAAVRDRKALADEIARLQEIGVGAAFQFEVGPDDTNSALNIPQLSQGGLSLPDRDYYLTQDASSKRLRAQYVEHVTRMFRLLGDGAATAGRNARTVLRIETRLARASMPLEETQDPIATYHKVSRKSLGTRASGFEWDAYFRGLGLDNLETLIIRQPKFFRELGLMAAGVPLSDWKTYLRWHLLRATARYLNSPFEREAFAFNGTILQGTQELPLRWKRVLGETDGVLGEALGKLYVERAFSPQAKQKALEMAGNLKAALRGRIQALDWMSESAKTQALAKLDAMRVKIGYPDVWRDYSTLEIGRISYLRNVIAGRTFEFRRNLAKTDKPVDRAEWSMTPITNNAYYEPTLNEINFPAGILQPPYFDPEADDAVNYGNIGATIGHEMTHGFDDGGRKYDARGNLRNWWTPEDEKAFRERTVLLARQFDAYEPIPGRRVNDTLTLDENIADLGGLKIAYDAFKLSQQDKPLPGLLDGLAPAQRFFLSYAETWRIKVRDEALRARLMTDEHAPARYRVLGPLANMPEFSEAFGCEEGDAMVRAPRDRPRIW